MVRNNNKTTNGRGFDPAAVQAVWQKAQAVPGYDANLYRKDSCGAWIMRSAHGSTEAHGWEVEHIKPVAKGGGDELGNLQPLHWQNNRHKADNWPHYSCAVGS